MTTKLARIALTAVVLTSAFGGLLWFSLQAGRGVLQARGRSDGQPRAVAGQVASAPWLRREGHVGAEAQHARVPFKVENKGSVVHASYTGILPDTFKDEAEVVLKGRLIDDGNFQVAPNGVMAKCPSKYEEAPKYDRKTGTSN